MWLVVRALGLALIAIALGMLGFELISMSRGNQFNLIPIGQLWFNLNPGSLNLFQAVTERYVSVWLWDNIFTPMLLWKAPFVFLVTGFFLAELERIVRWFRKLAKMQEV